ncbi:MAG: hypothetical protein PHP57_06380 [Sideroxydans sp.]|nr:hypothetical protein [Sideroxydans sp.]
MKKLVLLAILASISASASAVGWDTTVPSVVEAVKDAKKSQHEEQLARGAVWHVGIQASSVADQISGGASWKFDDSSLANFSYGFKAIAEKNDSNGTRTAIVGKVGFGHEHGKFTISPQFGYSSQIGAVSGVEVKFKLPLFSSDHLWANINMLSGKGTDTVDAQGNSTGKYSMTSFGLNYSF